MAQVSLAWCLSKPGTHLSQLNVTDLIDFMSGVSAPIVGTTSLKNLEELVGKSQCSVFRISILYIFPSHCIPQLE